MQSIFPETRAFTLIELLICLSMMMILSAIAFRSLTFNDAVMSDQLRDRVLQYINHAQTVAYSDFTPVHWCQSDDGEHCKPGSGEYQLISTKNHAFVTDRFPKSLHWQAFPRTQADLTFYPDQLRPTNNTTFWYCRKKQIKWAIFLSRSGRTRVVYPNAQHEIVDTEDRLLKCDHDQQSLI